MHGGWRKFAAGLAILKGDGEKATLYISPFTAGDQHLKPRSIHAKVTAPQAKFGWRQWIAILAMLTFAAQVQLIQTHIHLLSAMSGTTVDNTVASAPGKIAPAKNLPFNDQNSCPICQAVAHGGQFVSPTAIALSLPSFAASFIPLAIAVSAARESISHIWQGRAPPHA